MPDNGEIAEVLVLDQLSEQLGLIGYRIALVERLVGLAETFEIDGDDAMGLREIGRNVPPGEGARTKSVEEEHRRPLALFLVVEVDRRIRRTEQGKGPPAPSRRAEPARPEQKRGGGKPSVAFSSFLPLTPRTVLAGAREQQQRPVAGDRSANTCIAATRFAFYRAWS